MVNEAPSKLAFSIKEAIAASSIRRTKLYSLIKEGELDAVRIGGRTLIPADSLRALIANAKPVKDDSVED